MIRTTLAASALALLAAPAAAQDAAGDADLLCLAGMAGLAASEESEIRDAGVYGTIFYIGKLLGADPAFDVQGRLTALDYARITPAVQGQCLDEVRDVANRLVAIAGAGEAR